MRKRVIEFFIFFSLFLGCNTEKNGQIDPDDLLDLFPEKKVLAEGTPIQIPTEKFGAIIAVHAIRNWVAFRFFSDKMSYMAFDPKTGEVLNLFGKKGDGPNEVKMPFIQFPYQENTVGVFDKGNWAFFEWETDHLLTDSLPPKRRLVKDFDSNFISVIKWDHARYLGTGIFSNRFVLVDSSGKVLNSAMRYPFADQLPQVGDGVLAMAFQGSFNKHPKANLAAFATSRSPSLDILKVTDDHQIVSHAAFHAWPPLFSKQQSTDPNTISADFDPKNIQGFLDMALTDTHIFLLYSGESFASTKNPFQSKHILVFDWEARPVRYLELPMEASLIAVSENGQLLYALEELEDPILWEFSIGF